MARVTVFGAGAAGTALAMHLARAENDTVLWASDFDARVLPFLDGERKHPNLPAYLPESLRVMGPQELADAAKGAEVAVMGANSGGARSLAAIVVDQLEDDLTVLSLAKGLEPDSRKRMSEVYREVIGHGRVVSMGGPCLAQEVAEELPSAVVFACGLPEIAEGLRPVFETRAFRVTVTDDVLGLEYCTVLKNVAA
ncbi:MAG TPA: hypothetical protein VEO00_01295, partial [Actinomycetota bacterium]|nr:hypothetical protein [Actinomycetota bacterium]